MDFIENVKNAVADTAQTVAKKTGELIEISKIKYAVFDLKSDIKKLFAEIGKTYYHNLKDGIFEEEDMREICDLIDAKYAKIEALTAELEKVKNDAKCSSCGKINDTGLNYCPFCGARATAEADVNDSSEFAFEKRTDAANENGEESE